MKRFDIEVEQTYNNKPSWYPVLSNSGEYVKYSDVIQLKESFKILLNSIELIAITANNPNYIQTIFEHIADIKKEFDM